MPFHMRGVAGRPDFATLGQVNAIMNTGATRTVSLVTGGNRGIGREVCRQFAKRVNNALDELRSALRGVFPSEYPSRAPQILAGALVRASDCSA
jgi:hypothetical protein